MGIPSAGAAFLAGLVSFLSPCVLPLVPGYVSLISGVGVEQLQAQEASLFRKVMLNSVAFIIGFSIVFVTLGALSTEAGQLAAKYKSTLAQIAGVLIIVFGLHLTGIMRINALYADKRLHNVKGGSTAWGAFVIGFAFAFGWTPCVGPILSAILYLAAAQNSVAKGILLLTIYSLGLAVPFLLTAFGIGRFLKFYGRFRRHMHVIEVASGALLIVLGLLLVFGRFTLLSHYFSSLNRFVL
jgi:cytochrome c-type biogenesis protein